MNQKEVFLKVSSHLIKQGHKSLIYVGGAKQCRYRKGDDRCAIGALIPDEHYDAALEGLDVSNGKVLAVLERILGTLDNKDVDLLRHLQSIHDSCPPEQWGVKFAYLAKEMGWDLDVATVPENILTTSNTSAIQDTYEQAKDDLLNDIFEKIQIKLLVKP